MSQLPLNAAEDLINANEEWAQSIIRDNPDFFKDSAAYPQTPKVRSTPRRMHNVSR
jgi:carbonic anhydrase